MMPDDVLADPMSLRSARLLVVPEMDAAVDTGVVNVFADRFQAWSSTTPPGSRRLLRVPAWPCYPPALWDCRGRKKDVLREIRVLEHFHRHPIGGVASRTEALGVDDVAGRSVGPWN